jgi:hypothetical protein
VKAEQSKFHNPPFGEYFTSVSLETDKLRRRLEAATGYSAARLVTEALQLFDKRLASLARKPSRSVRR